MVIARAGGALARILDAWRRAAFVVAISEHLLEELRRTLANPYFGERLTRQDRETYLSFVQSTAQIVPLISEIAGIATHPEDDLVVATAVSAHADYLVTGDRRLRTQVPA